MAGAEAGVEGVHPSLPKWTLGRHKIFLSRSQSLSLSLSWFLSLSISVSQFRVLSLKLGFFLSISLQTTIDPDLFFTPKFLSLGLLIVFLFCVLISDKGNNVVPLIFYFYFFYNTFFLITKFLKKKKKKEKRNEPKWRHFNHLIETTNRCLMEYYIDRN